MKIKVFISDVSQKQKARLSSPFDKPLWSVARAENTPGLRSILLWTAKERQNHLQNIRARGEPRNRSIANLFLRKI